MRPLHRALAALLPVAVLMAMPAAGLAKRRFAPDLVVTKIAIKQLPGDPPYVIEDTAGHTPGFVVRVTIKNVGRATAKRSRTKLEFTTLGGAPVRGMSDPAPKLKPHASHTHVFKVDLSETRHPPLGLLKTIAMADGAETVHEVREHNNTAQAAHLPVIAQQWKVLDFMTTQDLNGSTLPGSLATTFTKTCLQVDCGRFFVFRFSTFDEAAKDFMYLPDGTIRGGWDYVYTPLRCTGHAAEAGGPRTWPGHLAIDDALDSYEGEIDVPDVAAPPARGQIACAGSPQTIPVEWGFQNLLTFVGEKQRPRMPAPSATKLTGNTERQTIGTNKTRWQWTFQADVPGA
jgi:hypothetical protein